LRKVLFLLALFFGTLAVLGFLQRGKFHGSIEVSGSTTLLPVTQAAAEEYMKKNPEIRVSVQGGGSSAGIEAAAMGASEIGMSSRELKGDELKLELVKYPVAIDAIAVIVNKKNPIGNLSSDEIRKIFSGEITNWKEVGGSDMEIVVVNRDEASGTREAFSKLLMKESEFTKKAVIQPGNGQVKAIVEGTPGAIGYLSLGYVTESVKTVALDGVKPSIETLKSGDYPLQRTLYYLTKGNPGKLAQDFISFVLSERIQEEIIGKEFIPVKEMKR
jgi:phosphate transport system substrate-binding protein